MDRQKSLPIHCIRGEGKEVSSLKGYDICERIRILLLVDLVVEVNDSLVLRLDFYTVVERGFDLYVALVRVRYRS